MRSFLSVLFLSGGVLAACAVETTVLEEDSDLGEQSSASTVTPNLSLGAWAGLVPGRNGAPDQDTSVQFPCTLNEGTGHWSWPAFPNIGGCDSELTLTSVAGNTYRYYDHTLTPNTCQDGIVTMTFTSPSVAFYTWSRLDGTLENEGDLPKVATSFQMAALCLPAGVAILSRANIAGARFAWARFNAAIPAGKTKVTVNTFGGTGDADLYVRIGAPPTLNTYDCKSTNVDNQDNCVLEGVAGTVHVGVYGSSGFTGLNLRVTPE